MTRRAPWLTAKAEAAECVFVGVVVAVEAEVATMLVWTIGVEEEAIVLVHGAIELKKQICLISKFCATSKFAYTLAPGIEQTLATNPSCLGKPSSLGQLFQQVNFSLFHYWRTDGLDLKVIK